MPQGTLEVLLVSAKGLENTEFLSRLLKNMDPDVVFTCRTQEQKSSVASGQWSDPEWNENFSFTISSGNVSELQLKILDSNWGTDDFVGEATIPLEPVFEQGIIPPASYNLVKDDKYCGEIRLGLTFTQTEVGYRRHDVEDESLGGWKDSTYTKRRGGAFNNDEENYEEQSHHYHCHGNDAEDNEKRFTSQKDSAYCKQGYNAE